MAIRKHKTAKVIPNAIQIETGEKKVRELCLGENGEQEVELEWKEEGDGLECVLLYDLGSQRVSVPAQLSCFPRMY